MRRFVIGVLLVPQSYISLFYLLGAVQGAFLAFSLFFNRTGSHQANRYLCLFTLMLTVGLLDYFLASLPDNDWALSFRTLSWSREFLFGVFIYFYARELTQPGRYPLRGSQWFHFIPAALHGSILLPLLATSPEQLTALLSREGLDTPIERLWSLLLNDVRFALEIVHLPIYLLLSYRLLLAHQQQVKAQFSYQESVSLVWLRNLILGTFIVYLIWVLEDLFSIGLGVRVVLGVAMVCLIYTMGYLGLKQPLIFVDRRVFDRFSPAEAAAPESDLSTEVSVASDETRGTTVVVTDDGSSDEVSKDETQGRYQNSSLSSSSSELLFQEIDEFVATKELYLEPQLSLPQLADQLGYSIPYVSQAINQQTGLNFFDFVNLYRVKKVIAQLEDPSELPGTMLALGLAAGFNSKSAFYTAFKKVTGQSPGQYRAKVLAN